MYTGERHKVDKSSGFDHCFYRLPQLLVGSVSKETFSQNRHFLIMNSPAYEPSAS